VIERVRRRLTFSNVVSLVALFVALGGTSYAALRVTSGDVVDRSLRSVDVRKHTLTGAEIDKARLGAVPLALSAQTVGGARVRRVDYRSSSSTDRRTLIDLGGLVVEGDCPAGSLPRIEVGTRVDHAHVVVSGVVVAGITQALADDSFEDQDFMAGFGDSRSYAHSPSNVTIGYATQGGSHVTANLHLMDATGSGAPKCTIGGYAVAG